jgi:hypothetical protein
MLSRVKNYWKPYFEGKTVKSIIRADLKAFSLHLTDERPPETIEVSRKGRGCKKRVEKLAPASINKIMNAGTVALG